jgi:hypothetical protein
MVCYKNTKEKTLAQYILTRKKESRKGEHFFLSKKKKEKNMA